MKEPHDFDEEIQPTHISYKEYQKKVTKNPNEGLIMFVSAFFVMLLLFLGIAKQISPEIDVSIGEENNVSTEDALKTSVDDRLKLIQNEDNTENVQDDTFSPELDEKIKLPENTKKSDETAEEEPQKEEAPITLPEKNATPKPAATASVPPKPTVAPMAAGTNAKVVVGYYTTKEQAEVAKGIISEAGLNISPFVRNIGGAYTIQVGSYSTREKAQTVVNDLLRNNYPARVIIE